VLKVQGWSKWKGARSPHKKNLRFHGKDGGFPLKRGRVFVRGGQRLIIRGFKKKVVKVRNVFLGPKGKKTWDGWSQRRRANPREEGGKAVLFKGRFKKPVGATG